VLLLDTHAFVWLASDQEKLPKQAMALIEESAPALFLSSISALEIGMLVKRKRLKLPKPPAEFFEIALNHHGIEEITIDGEIALASVILPDHHDDPFDRIILATALLRGLAVLSKDQKFRQYEAVTTQWD